MHELLSVVIHGTPARQYTGTRVRWYTRTTFEEHGYRREFWFRIVAREQTIVASVLLHYRGRAEAAIWTDRVVAPPLHLAALTASRATTVPGMRRAAIEVAITTVGLERRRWRSNARRRR